MASEASSSLVERQLALGLALEPPNSLALRDAVWGIDPSTLRIAVGLLLPGGDYSQDHSGPRVAWDVQSLPRNPGDPARWFAAAFADLVPFFGRLRAEYGQPLLVLVEEPFGGGGKPGDKRPRTVHPSSNRMLGVTLAALGRVCGGFGTEVDLIGPGSWKRDAMGRGKGAAKPPQYLAWAREVCGYSGELEDEAAALGIATAAGVRVVGRAFPAVSGA